MMERKSCIAALDVGTSSVKVCLFDLHMNLVSRSVQEYTLDAHGDRVEVDGQVYLNAIRAGVREALTSVSEYRVAAIGVTTQGETLAPVDAHPTAVSF